MSNRSQFRTIDKFSIFYGQGGMDRLVRYDAVVVEPANRTSEEIQALHDSGALVLAYVSVMEVHTEHPLAADINEADFLRREKEPFDYIMQTTYNNRLVDLCSPRWQGLLLRHVGELITRHGYDGVFLDTIGDVEMPEMPRPMQQIEAATFLVEQMRKWFPDAILIQNNGLEVLCMQTAEFLDAICWENPPIDIPDSRRWVHAVAQRLVQLRIAYNLRVLVLFEGSHQDSRSDFIRGRSFTDEFGFTPYFSPQHYQSFHG